MRAAVFLGEGKIEIRDVPVPAPGDGEALLRVTVAGVCGTDAHIYTGEVRNAVPPVVLGHEITGEVVETGRGVVRFRRGDRAAVDPFVPCGRCEYCREGEERFCANERFFGYTIPGGFAEYVTVPETNLYPIPEGLSIKQCALVEPLATVVAGVGRLRPEPGRNFLLLGAGTIGLLWLQMLRGSARAVIQTELVKERGERAKTLGADLVIDPAGGCGSGDREQNPAGSPHAGGCGHGPTPVVSPLAGALRELCPRGVDYIVDCTGSSAAVGEALPLLKKGGTFLSFGICPEGERVPLSLNWFYKNQATFLTSRRPPKEMARAIGLLAKGLVDAESVVTGVYPLAETEKTFTRFFEDRASEVKMAIDPRV